MKKAIIVSGSLSLRKKPSGKKAIIVSGSVGAGKTTFAMKLANKLKLSYLSINDVIDDHKISKSYDKKRKSKIVDVDKLNKVLIGLIKNSKKKLVIDGHLSHYLPRKYVDVCYIVKCGLKELKKRLEKRGYSKQKIRENLDAEIFDVCLEEAREQGHKIKVVEGGKS